MKSFFLFIGPTLHPCVTHLCPPKRPSSVKWDSSETRLAFIHEGLGGQGKTVVGGMKKEWEVNGGECKYPSSDFRLRLKSYCSGPSYNLIISRGKVTSLLEFRGRHVSRTRTLFPCLGTDRRSGLRIKFESDRVLNYLGSKHRWHLFLTFLHQLYPSLNPSFIKSDLRTPSTYGPGRGPRPLRVTPNQKVPSVLKVVQRKRNLKWQKISKFWVIPYRTLQLLHNGKTS